MYDSMYTLSKICACLASLLHNDRRVYLYVVFSLAAHVFFDDAMELDDDEERVVNQFVRLLVTCMDEAAR